MGKGILYSNGVVASLSQGLLTPDFLNRISDCSSKDEVLDCLEETSFSFSEEEISIEEKVEMEINKLVEFVKNESPNDMFAQFFLLPFDYENILTFCKCVFLNLELSTYFKTEGMFAYDQIKNSLLTKNYNNFNNAFLRNALVQFDKLIEDKEINGWEIDYIFKKAMFENLLKISQNSILNNLVKMQITIENISVAFRAKSQFELESQILLGGYLTKKDLLLIFNKDKFATSLNVDREILSFIKLALSEMSDEKAIHFEKSRQNLSVKYLQQYKDDISSIAPFAYYCYRKLCDIKNIRLVFSYVENGLSTEIKKRMLKGEK